VARLVDGVTKFEKALYGESAETETIRKMLVAADADVRVLIIKVADRLHNMRTIEARSTASRARIALATQDVLIPLLRPPRHPGSQTRPRGQCAGRARAGRARDPADLGRAPSGVDRLYRLVHRHDGVAAAGGEDPGAGRIPTPPPVLGLEGHLRQGVRGAVRAAPHRDHRHRRGERLLHRARAVHSTWRPVSGRFKDFIAAPKNNLYRSLHTTVIGPDDRAVEILIRTADMHRNAEYGIAGAFRARRGPGAHSARGRSRGVPVRVSGEHLAWLRSVVEWQTGAVDGRRFLESLRCDLAEGQVHVFAGGRRLLLPANSTPIDVAYAGGPEVGDRCVAATVNGQLAFLSSPLADGDVVEIHTAPMGETRGADGRPIGPSPEC